MDYCLLTKKDSNEHFVKSKITPLTMKHRRAKSLFGVPVPQNRVDPHDWSIRQVKRVIDYLGYSILVLRCAQESSISKAIESIRVHRIPNTQAAVEMSPNHDSQSNGLAENANHQLEGQVQTMLDALECKLGEQMMQPQT